MKAINPAAVRPGAATGRTTLRKAWKRVAPSIMAISSMSTGMVEKYSFRIQIVIGKVKTLYEMISAQGVSIIPRLR